MKEDLMWKTLSEKKVLDCRIFSVVMAEREAGDGRKGTFVEIDSPDWVVAIPWFLKDGVPYFIMEEQFRHGTATVTREFPAGLVERGEKAASAAEREMMEETGMAGDFTELGTICPNNAFMNNRQSFFLVTGLEKKAGQSFTTINRRSPGDSPCASSAPSIPARTSPASPTCGRDAAVVDETPSS